jgi:hypothetical protein
MVASYFCCSATDFTAAARFKQPAPAEAPPGTPGPAPQPQPQSQPAPSGGDQPQTTQSTDQRSTTPTDFALTATAPKVSAKKAKKLRSFSVSVKTSRAIQTLTATLRKGTKTVGKGTVKGFSGNGKIKVAVPESLKAGSYTLSLVGNDNGVIVARNLKLKITK